jgi:RHS repeat-associated protein
MTATSAFYYLKDASGCTSHLADSSGHLIEWYRYDLHGTPVVYDATNTLRVGGSAYGIRHLFTGEQWYGDVGLYDLRNRFYSPDSGRLLQPDPIGFAGDSGNIYRYCGNSPMNGSDPSGLADGLPGEVAPVRVEADGGGGWDVGIDGWTPVGAGGLGGIASLGHGSGIAGSIGNHHPVVGAALQQHPFGDGGSTATNYDGRVIVEGFNNPIDDFLWDGGASLTGFGFRNYGSNYLQAFAMTQASGWSVPENHPVDIGLSTFTHAFAQANPTMERFVNYVAFGSLAGGAVASVAPVIIGGYILPVGVSAYEAGLPLAQAFMTKQGAAVLLYANVFAADSFFLKQGLEEDGWMLEEILEDK